MSGTRRAPEEEATPAQAPSQGGGITALSSNTASVATPSSSGTTVGAPSAPVSPLPRPSSSASVVSSTSSSSNNKNNNSNLAGSPASLGSVGRTHSGNQLQRAYSNSSSTSVGTADGGAARPTAAARTGLRHLSGTAFNMSRPVSPPTASARDRFEAAVATSNLATSSSGLQALLRDHPELVSSSLAAAAGPGLQEFSQVEGKRPGGFGSGGGGAGGGGGGTASTSGSRANSVHEGDGSFPATPADELGSEGAPAGAGAGAGAAGGAHSSGTASAPDPMTSSYVGQVLHGAPGIGEGGKGAGHAHGQERKEAQLGAAGARPDYSQKIVVATVGLPARGKSYLSNKLMRYLRWLEYDVKVFNVGQLRRALAQAKLKNSGVREQHTADFFDPNNEIGYTLRKQMAEECLEQLIGWLKRGGNVGILDATNSTRSRRKFIAERVSREPGMTLVFLESICTDPDVIAANIAVKVSSGDPDYANMDPEDAKRDFIARIKQYETSYETVDKEKSEAHLSYCKITDVGRSVIVNQFQGYLESRIAFYLMNLHLTPRNIFFSRHGESQFNVQGKIGGDSDLSERGWAYARALPQLIKDNIGDKPLTVWHSTLRRTAQTASHLPYAKLAWKSLDELDAGVCDGMTYEEIEQYYPEDYASRDEDKFNYRYRGGESYRDVVVRLEPVIMELERQENILIVGHQAILRALYAYFHSLSQEELPYIKIPLHTVIQLTPKAYGCDEKRFRLPIEAVDTHRPKPASKASPLPRAASPAAAEHASTRPPPSQQRPAGGSE
ncbi:Fructose-2,6-bisphosphatase [Tilletia horrida]|nr:Fructose-2,6-bisphosphatase [Tilletia horrida]